MKTKQNKRRVAETETRRTADAIAKMIFTDGMKRRAIRLDLVGIVDGEEMGLGGWCEEAVTDRIEELLILRSLAASASLRLSGRKERSSDSR